MYGLQVLFHTVGRQLTVRSSLNIKYVHIDYIYKVKPKILRRSIGRLAQFFFPIQLHLVSRQLHHTETLEGKEGEVCLHTASRKE